MESAPGPAAPRQAAGDPREFSAITDLHNRKEYEQCIRRLNAYLRRYPRDAAAWATLGTSHRHRDEDDLAERAYSTALSIDGRNTGAMVGMGVICRKRRLYADALSWYHRATDLDANNADAWSSMSVIALKQKRDRVALEFAEKAYRLSPDDGVIVANYAIALHYGGKPAECRQMMQRAEALGYLRMATLREIVAGTMTIRD